MATESLLTEGGSPQVMLAFRFRTDGVLTADPDGCVNSPGVCSAVAHSDGVFTCTVNPPPGYNSLVACVAGVEAEHLEFAAYQSWTSSTKALVVEVGQYSTEAAAAVIDSPAEDNRWIHVIAIFQREITGTEITAI